MEKMKNMFLGDIHGNLGLIHQYIDLYGLKNVNIIQVGDFGVGFSKFKNDKRFLEMYHHKLVKNNIFVYAIRGNHDYKPYFDEDPFNLTNIKLIKDYTVLNLGEKNILCIGGAISVDRGLRKNFRNKLKINTADGFTDWWEDEVFIFDKDKLEQIRNVDIVVTHTSPTCANPIVVNGFGSFVEDLIEKTGDIELRTELLYERHLVQEMFNILKKNNKILYNFYGHFHKNAEIEVEGIKHILLGIGELWEDKTSYYNNMK